ncbi:MAG: toast rack family protein [Anaerolineae bacterium]|jgi:hypothetical protein
MEKPAIALAALALLISTLACTITPQIPDIRINVPTIEVGELQEERRSVPLSGTEPVDVDILFGAGRLELEAGVPDDLLSGYFRYNVERWAPEITFEGSELTIRQGGDEDAWGIPSGNIRNRWELEFSPSLPLEMDLRAGAGEGELDLTDLMISSLDVDIGAGDFALRFDKPNAVAMDHLTLDTGASKIEVVGVGNANLQTMRLQGGVGDVSLDLTGGWSRSAEITVRAGAGALTLRLPKNVGVEVETRGGLTNVEAYGLRQMGSTYTNDAFGETEIELRVSVTTGVGNVRLIEEGARE